MYDMDLLENSVKDPINHWYYKHKFYFIKREFSHSRTSPVLMADIGAGSALFSKKLINDHLVDSVTAVDTGYEQDFFCEKDKIAYVRAATYSDLSHFLLTDVLEHIRDDEKFLSSIVSEAPKDSKFIITVPALMCLWSGHDEYLNHFRRYSKQQLRELVQNSGLEVLSVRYTYSTVFPLAFIQRQLSQKR
jgi:hypothetical protein